MLEVPATPEKSRIDEASDESGRHCEPAHKPPAGILFRLSTFFDTTIVAAVAVGLVVGAHTYLENRAAAVQIEQVATPLPVRTHSLQIVESYRVPRHFVGQVEAAQTTRIAFELAGRVDEIMVDEASVVKKGDVLARLDTRIVENRRETQIAARKALEARAEKSRLTNDRRKTLNEKGFMANQLLDEARLDHAELQALIVQLDSSIAGIDIEIDKSVIRAPFDGRIGDRFVDIGATVSAGQPIVTIMQSIAPEMRVGLSDEMAADLNVGDTVTARIGAARYEASLTQLRADIDPRTRTRTAIFSLTLASDEAAPLYGQTGTVILWQTIRQQGAWVPVTALRDGTRGLWTVLSVQPGEDEGQGVVAAEAVEVLYADQERAFVRGTFARDAVIIEAGPHRVTAGQTVILDGGAGPSKHAAVPG